MYCLSKRCMNKRGTPPKSLKLARTINRGGLSVGKGRLQLVGRRWKRCVSDKKGRNAHVGVTGDGCRGQGGSRRQGAGRGSSWSLRERPF